MEGARTAQDDLVQVKDLQMYFPITAGLFRRRVGDIKAVDGISLNIKRGQTLAIVGESGSGKTTLGRAILRLAKPTGGEIWFDGVNILRLSGRQFMPYRQRMQVIFQDPYSSLHPRMTVGSFVGEPLVVHRLAASKVEYRRRVAELFRSVGLDPAMTGRYPHEFSGGQRQRIGIARALAMQPEFIVADEPVSALDVSVQAQILNLLADLQDQFGLTYMVIAHDLSVVRHIASRVVVMYLGKVMEISSAKELFDDPLHPYTQALMSAVPIPDPRVERARQRQILVGDIPSPANPPSGCVFHTRCPIAIDECRGEAPALRETKPGHWTACIRV
ncbi:MAG: ATP-binding cassette domain-containing protein [Dehalococcoidia bacterium]|nr:ATP-binding cassette domain-containing protein [Dehalococcoidia bacterium]